MCSDGLPAMLETTSEEGEDESEAGSSMDPKAKAALAKSAMETSPPPVAKKDWKLKAGKETKGKQGKKRKKPKKHTFSACLFLGSSLQCAQLVRFSPFFPLVPCKRCFLPCKRCFSLPCTRVTMASPSPSPDYKRCSPSPKREAQPQRSRSNSQNRWGKKKEDGSGE